MKNERLEAYQEKKILKKIEETFEDQDWSEMREFGGENREQLREIEQNEGQIARGGLNRSSVNLDR